MASRLSAGEHVPLAVPGLWLLPGRLLLGRGLGRAGVVARVGVSGPSRGGRREVMAGRKLHSASSAASNCFFLASKRSLRNSRM